MDVSAASELDRSIAPSPATSADEGTKSLAEIRAQQREVREARRRAAAEWRPAHSTAYQNVSLTLRTSQAQRVFHLGLVSAQRSLYMIYHTLNAEHGEEALELAEEIINKKFEELETRIQGECKRLDHVIQTIAAEPIAGYTSTMDHQVCMYTPEAARFGRLLSSYDQLVVLADTLRFAGHLKRKDHNHVVHDPRNAITRFSRQLHLTYMQARNKARRAMQNAENERFKRATAAAAGSDTHHVANDASDVAVDGDASAPITQEAAVSKPRGKKSSKTDSGEPAVALG